MVHQQLHVIQNTAHRPSTQASYTASRIRPKKEKHLCSGANCSNTHNIISSMAPHEFNVIPRTVRAPLDGATYEWMAQGPSIPRWGPRMAQGHEALIRPWTSCRLRPGCHCRIRILWRIGCESLCLFYKTHRMEQFSSSVMLRHHLSIDENLTNNKDDR